MKTTAWTAGLLLLGIVTAAPNAFAQTDCTKTVPVSPFGAGDQTGATNRVTPAVTKTAPAEIQTGKVTTMTQPLSDGVPLFGTRFTKTILTATSLAPGAAFGDNNLTYMEAPGSARAMSARTSTAWAISAAATATTSRRRWWSST